LLKNTFIHIQGIGTKTEKSLWLKGIRKWGDFLKHSDTIISAGRDPFVSAQIEDSIKNINDIRFFNDRLPASDSWRLFDEFKDRAVYLDIETSGTDYLGIDEITVIGLYDGGQIHTFVNGRNMEDFEEAISIYDLVITFNGSCFDLPFIRRYFPGISLPPGHIDLRFFLKKLGFKGGLKAIEKEFGIGRDSAIDGMDGFEAIRLWNAFKWGDNRALDLLIQYNRADIVNLEPLMEMGYSMMKNRLLPDVGQDL
jgi:uncharacterized protein YprB with RNaseH-like and TPR domain